VLEATGEYNKISQLVVAIPALRVTGVKGDGRAYRYPVWIRAVESSDFMTARGYRFGVETQEKLEQALTAHREIVAVSYWPTSKPPQTVEFE
jgi:GMP synthase (glutamine-hydrolysing)